MIDVSRDAVSEDPRTADRNPPSEISAHNAGSPTYIARIELARSTMSVDGKLRSLRPGMVVTAEIRTGERSIIDYIFSPIARRTEESLHER